MEADFSGWATKANLKCSDGRTIMPEAFAHMDGMQVPLVWQHKHSEVDNVLGHAVLTAKPEGVWAEGFFNDTPQGQNARKLVEHKDVDSLSIFANQLVEKSKQVFHGMIRELSLVISGANPGAKIENIRIAHSEDDEIYTLDDEAIIWTGLTLAHSDEGSSDASDEADDEVEEGDEEEVDAQEVFDSFTDEQKAVVHSMLESALTLSAEAEEGDVVHAATSNNPDETLQDVYNSLSDKQKNLVHYMIGAALESAASNTAAHSGTESEDEGSDDETNNEGDLIHQEGNDDMSRNVFEQNGLKASDAPTLSHDQLNVILADAQKPGSTLKESFLAHAVEYGIEDIDMLFPDAKSLTSQPDLLARRTEWVASVLDGAKHSPFSRIKSLTADLTADEARAKGYVKGNLKKDEIVRLLKRTTGPTTVYKKQKLDRDDIIDITSLDVVAWLKWEMRFMLEEELARAILIGDGREPDDEDKINEDSIRPIAWDDDLYSHKVTLPTNSTPDEIVEGIIRSRKNYKGTGRPTLFTSDDVLTDMLLIKDRQQRYVYANEAELAAKLRVDSIVVVEVMENEPDLLAIIVNLADYTIGADQGGQLSMFDDFDIDYNQNKYLIETRVSGALTKVKSALVVKRTSGTTVTPTAPTYNSTTHVITFPTVTGVDYQVDGVTKTGTLTISETTDVEAVPQAGYNFPHNIDADWTFAYTS